MEKNEEKKNEIYKVKNIFEQQHKLTKYFPIIKLRLNSRSSRNKLWLSLRLSRNKLRW